MEGRSELLAEALEITPYEQNTWTEMALEVRGDHLICSVGGEVVLEARDGRLPAGGVGLYSWHSRGVLFDDVVAEPL